MPNSFVTHTANGSQATFSFAAIDDYLSSGYLKIYVDDVLQTTGYTVNTTTEVITFSAGFIPAANKTVKIARETPSTVAGFTGNIVDFADGSILTASDLDRGFKGILHIVQEANDTGSGALGKTADQVGWDAGNLPVRNAGLATAPGDLVTKAQLDSVAVFGASTVPQSWSATGTGSATVFPLSPAASATDPQMFLVEVGGVLQRPTDDYTLTANEITFTGGAPANGVGIRIRNFGVARNALSVLPDSSVTTQYLADNSVTTAKIVDGNVTAVKLAANSVATVSVQDAAITTAKIADDSITAVKMAANSVEGSKIQNLSISDAKLAANSVTSSKIAVNSVAFGQLKSNGFTNAGGGIGQLLHVDDGGHLNLGIPNGPWTPVIGWSATTGSPYAAPTYSTQNGYYLKLGNWVFIHAYIDFSRGNNTTTSATLRITGLPFPPDTSVVPAHFGVAMKLSTNVVETFGLSAGTVAAGDKRIDIFCKTAAAADATALTYNNLLVSNNIIRLSGFYLIQGLTG